MSLHPNLLGPVGNSGPCCQSNQKAFNSKKWLDSQDLTLSGIVFYHGEYLYGVQFLGVKKYIQDGEWHCKGIRFTICFHKILKIKTIILSKK